MPIKQKKTAQSEVKCVEIDTRLKLPNSHGLVSLTVTSPRKFLQPSSDKSVKKSTSGEMLQKAHGCKSISCVNPEKFNLRKTRAKESSIGLCMEKELATQHSKQLLNAVGIFNSNKELFISLLENPSSLLVNQVENFQDCRAKRKKTKHFHAGKSAESHAKKREASSVEEDDPRPPRNLVVLKPSPLTRQDSVQRLSLCSFLHYHSMFVRKRQRSRPPYISIGNLKRKIMHALKLGGKEALRRTSSSRSYLDNGSRSDPENRDKTTRNMGASIAQSYESSKIYGKTKSNIAEDLSPETKFDQDEFIQNGSEIVCSVEMATDNSINIDLSQRIDTSNIDVYGKKMDGDNWPNQERFSSDASAREEFKFDELPVHALKADVEVHSSSPKIPTRGLRGNFASLDRNGPISECVKALVLASRFRCEELVVKCCLFDRMNVLTLLDQLKSLRGQLCGDCRLLADYISDILEDLRQCHKEHMFHEVMRQVSCHQFMQQPLPTTWEKLAEENVTRSRTWRDSPDNAEAIIDETTESVLEELIMESTSDV